MSQEGPDQPAPPAGELQTPLVSVVVCSLNGERVLPACLTSVLACKGPPFEVIVVNNGSEDSTPDLVRERFPVARLINIERNLGFSGGNNVGIQAARGEIIVLLNDDTEVPEDWVAAMAAPFARDPRIGSVGCKLLYPGGRIIQHAGGAILPNGNTVHLGTGEEDNGQWETPRECDYVTGAALAMRREALAQVGLLDPKFFPIYFEEVDLEVRMARAGWKLWYEPAAWLIHHESLTQVAGSPRFIYRYTRNRMRYLTLRGLPGGCRAALKVELRWLLDMARKGRLGSVLRAYASGVLHWPAWRLDRRPRRSVPALDNP